MMVSGVGENAVVVFGAARGISNVISRNGGSGR